MGRHRTDRPLTAAEQELAAQAFEHARPTAEKYLKNWGRFQVDFSSEVALRICQRISTFDSSRSSLWTWSNMLADFACRDALRMLANTPESRVRNRRLRFVNMDTPLPRRSGYAFADLFVADPSPDLLANEQAMELLRGLTPVERTAVWETVVNDRTCPEVGEDLGVHATRVSQLRVQALAFLREHRREECA